MLTMTKQNDKSLNILHKQQNAGMFTRHAKIGSSDRISSIYFQI